MKKKTQFKKWLPWVILVMVAAGLAALPLLSSGQEKPSDVQVTVKTAQAALRDVPTVLVGGGQLESSDEFSVKIPENVKIKQFLVGNGDTVLEGDPICRVDLVSVMTAITEVEATLQQLSEQINSADSSVTYSTIASKPAGTVKQIYASAGDDLEDVMLQHGALAVISLDNVMAVQLQAATGLSAGDKVTVEINGTQVTGRVKSNVAGELTVTVEDKKYSVGTPASVTAQDGTPIGSGELYVYNAWNVTGYSGTVSAVYAKAEQTVYAGQSLFSVTETGKTPEYQRAIDKRQQYESLLQELFRMYDSGLIVAPCDGIVSGVDTDGTYMLAAEPGATGPRIMLLDNLDLDPIIVTSALPGGTVGESYSMQLQAAVGDELASGTWAAAGLPGGLALDSAAGIISGTPTTAGTFPVSFSFTVNDKTCTADLSITIEDKPGEPQYTVYGAQVTVAGGNVIKVKQTAEPTAKTADLSQLPATAPDVSTMTEEAVYEGQTVVGGNFSVGDTLWVVLDENGTLVKTINLSSGGNEKPGGNSGGKMPGGGGMPSGFGGFGATTEEDDGLYSLEKLTIATVTSQERMTISISVDELDITKVYVGQTAEITMNAFAGEPVEAVVKKIANSGENGGGNSKFTVELELQKSSEMLPGMNATATITLSTAGNVLCVPSAAVYELNGKPVVFTARDEKTESLSGPVEVTTGTADADYVEILSGLDEGTTVFYEIYEGQSLPVFL